MQSKELFNPLMAAVSNEAYSDRIVCIRMGVSNLNTYRPQRQLPLLIQSSSVRLLFVCALIFYFILCALKNIIFSLFQRKSDKCAVLGDIFIISSPRAAFLQKKYEINDVTEIDMKKKSYVNFLGAIDLFKALWFSLSILKEMLALSGLSKIYYLHDLYDMVLFSIFLEKYTNKKNVLHFTNHYDRWAVLLDCISKSRLFQYQHGLVADFYFPPHKLKRIEKVFCMNQSSISVWKNNICESPNVLYESKDYTVQLQPYAGAGTVLIISNPLFKMQELKIICALIERKKTVFYKIHPLYLYDEKLFKGFGEKFIVVHQQLFPHCEKTICNGSTLGVEYEASGVDVDWWVGEVDLQLLLRSYN